MIFSGPLVHDIKTCDKRQIPCFALVVIYCQFLCLFHVLLHYSSFSVILFKKYFIVFKPWSQWTPVYSHSVADDNHKFLFLLMPSFSRPVSFHVVCHCFSVLRMLIDVVNDASCHPHRHKTISEDWFWSVQVTSDKLCEYFAHFALWQSLYPGRWASVKQHRLNAFRPYL